MQQRRREGRPIIDLTASNPTRAGFEYPQDLLAPLSHCRGLTYAPEPFGAIDARQAIAEDYARRGVRANPERMVLTSSTSEAYSLLFKLLMVPGDEVLVPRPSYPLFELLTSLDGVVARHYELEYHGVWSIDLESVDRAWSPRTRALLVVTPNNPTGSFVRRQELDCLAARCASRGAALIADEVFADYVLDPVAAGNAGRILASEEALVFALGGLSKSVGLPQVKLGWIAAAGDDRVVSDALSRLEIVCDSYLSVSTPVQLAARELLERGAVVRAQIASRIAGNDERLLALALNAPACTVIPTEGGWYAVVQVPTLRSEEELVLELLNIDGVLAHPGYFFDFARESFVVVSLLPPEDQFAIGVERLFARVHAS